MNRVAPVEVQFPRRSLFFSYFLLFLPPFFWSTSFIVGRALAGQIPPWTLNAGRFGVSALILLIVLLCRRNWQPVPREFILPLVLMGLTGVFAFGGLVYTGLHYTTAINAALVNSTAPVSTACIAWLFIGESMTLRRTLGALLSFAGVGWLVGHGSLETLYRLSINLGDAIVFVATIVWGVYSVLAKRMMRILSPIVLTAVTTGIGEIFLLPASLFELSIMPVELPGWKAILAFLYLGIFSSLVAHWAWNRSILTFGPSRTALVHNSMPVFGVILSVIFLGEALMPYQLAGGVVIVAGVILGTTDSTSVVGA